MIKTACGDYDDLVQPLFLKLYDREFLMLLGLLKGKFTFSNASVKEDMLIAEVLFDFQVAQVSHELTSLMAYSHRPPLAFLSGLEEDDTVQVASLMAWVHQLHTTVESLELLAADPVAHSYLLAMQFPSNVFSRECMVAARECHYKKFPADVKKELQAVSEVFGTSLITEQSHSVIVEAQRQSKGGSLGRVAKMHRVFSSPLLKDIGRLRRKYCRKTRLAPSRCP